MRYLVTGGAGFIGANFLRKFVVARTDIEFVNVDALTYAGNAQSLEPIQKAPNYRFVKGDITDAAFIHALIKNEMPDVVVHFAAESHVDRSIAGPVAFAMTNVIGTLNLLEGVRSAWGARQNHRFHHVSTDEVYGSLTDVGYFTEQTPYDPSSPYSASKASSDHFVRAYYRTFGIPVTISNCSNNYGPLQFPEKLIPLMILRLFKRQPLPIYGNGSNVRDWLHVEDHCDAIWRILESGKVGETYNVGGDSERSNLQVVKLLTQLMSQALKVDEAELTRLHTFVTDRPGHDQRYAIDATKLKGELGWRPTRTFESGLADTVSWYLSNPEWVQSVESGAYRDWIQKHYT